jgi:hypothetical protein
MRDSVIYFERDPVIWSDKSQLTARSVTVKMRNNTIDSLKMYLSSFIISLDEYKNYNQIKGKNIYAGFSDLGYTENIKVDGNAEAIFYVINEEKKRPSGINSSICSTIDIFFADSNQISHVLFNKDVDGKLIPMHELNEENKVLKGFVIRSDERPSIKSIMDGRELKNDKRKKRKDPVTGRAIPDSEGDIIDFEIKIEDNHLVFSRRDISPEDLKTPFFLQITPQNVIDLPETQQAAGIVYYNFNFMPEDILGDGTIRKKLPDYPIKKIVTGQEEKGKGVIWKKIIEAKNK